MIKITPEIKKLIEENAMALATSDKFGNPHCIAVGDAKIVSDDQILIGDNYMFETKNNIQKNPNVALIIHDNNIGYGLKGKAQYITSGKWANEVKKIHKGFPAKGAILITINKIKKLA